MFVLDAFFENGLPEALAKDLPKTTKIAKGLDLMDCAMFSTNFHMQVRVNKHFKNTQINLNTSPTCFEGPRGRK